MIKNFNLSPGNVDNFISKLKSLDLENVRYVANVVEIENNRSAQQNRLSHAWYGELANNFKDNDAIGYKCFCKLHFGVPIMRAENDEFRSVYDTAIKKLNYEQKIEIMKILPVTSLMNTKQLTKYLDEIKDYFDSHYGYALEYPMSFNDET